MRTFLVAVVATSTLCALSANAQQLSAQSVTLANEASGQQNWVFGTHECNFQWDDGKPEVGVGIYIAGEFAWIQTFGSDDTCNCIGQIETRVVDDDTLPTDLTIYVWDDPTNDKDPSDAVLLATGKPVLVENTDLAVFDLDHPVEVSGDFFVGAMVFHLGAFADPPEFPAPYDTTVPSLGRAWAVFDADEFNPNDLPSNGLFGEVVALGLQPGVWVLRAIGVDPALCAAGECDPCDMGVCYS